MRAAKLRALALVSEARRAPFLVSPALSQSTLEREKSIHNNTIAGKCGYRNLERIVEFFQSRVTHTTHFHFQFEFSALHLRLHEARTTPQRRATTAP